MRRLLGAMCDVDKGVMGRRKNLFKPKLRDEVKGFMRYYNKVSGSEEGDITIPDLEDKELIGKYISNKIYPGISESDKYNVIIKILNKFMDYHGDNLSVEHYRTLIEEGMRRLPSGDGRKKYLEDIVKCSNLDKLMMKAEDGDSGFIEGIFNKAGYSVDQEDLDAAIEKSVGEEKEEGDMYPRIFKTE